MDRTLSEWIVVLLQAQANPRHTLSQREVVQLREVLEDVANRLDAPSPEPEEFNCHECMDRLGPDEIVCCRDCYRELESVIDAVKDATAGH